MQFDTRTSAENVGTRNILFQTATEAELIREKNEERPDFISQEK